MEVVRPDDYRQWDEQWKPPKPSQAKPSQAKPSRKPDWSLHDEQTKPKVAMEVTASRESGKQVGVLDVKAGDHLSAKKLSYRNHAPTDLALPKSAGS